MRLNEASIRFHERLGFERVAYFREDRPDRLCVSDFDSQARYCFGAFCKKWLIKGAVERQSRMQECIITSSNRQYRMERNGAELVSAASSSRYRPCVVHLRRGRRKRRLLKPQGFVANPQVDCATSVSSCDLRSSDSYRRIAK